MADPLTDAEQLERDVLRLVTIAKARQRWRRKMMGRAIGSWTMVHHPQR